jgi:L-2-hydroxycarboxylate dehydrogenase (NAD+)
MTAETVLVSADEERAIVCDVLQRYGASPEPAQMQANWLLEADLRGFSSHGIERLPILVARMKRHLIEPDAEPAMSWRTDSVLVVDGNRGFGPVIAQRALAAGIQQARTTGLALIAISNANHLGILAPYVESVAAAGMIGIGLSTSEALVHPWGGRDAMVGTNPIAISVPAQPSSFVLDMATGQVSMGRVLHNLELGVPLEEGWAVDADGVPTLDPVAALKGAISPFGGPKGFALGLALEILVASLTGTALGRDVHGTLDADDVCNKGDLFICIDPQIVGPTGSTDVSSYLGDVRATPPQPGTTGVRIPGERTAAERARRVTDGIEITMSAWRAAMALLEADREETGDSVISDDVSA